jgi:hypothetical protein
MNVNDLLALLHDARQELCVLPSYLGDPKMEWPSYGLKTTAQAHKRMVERIDEFLASGTPEETSLREENLALRAALRARANDEEWRARYLESEKARVEASRILDRLCDYFADGSDASILSELSVLNMGRKLKTPEGWNTTPDGPWEGE